MQNPIGLWLLSLKHYLSMCLLLSSPERLPASLQCIVLSIFSYFLIGLLLIEEQHGYLVICQKIILELVMLGLIAYTGLRWKKLLARFQQTFSALVGINVIFTLVSIPFIPTAPNSETDTVNPVFYVHLFILFWNLAVVSLIFKRSFEISTHLSAIITISYFALYFVIIGALF